MAERYIGLISGTSMDAVDAVLVEFAADAPMRVVATCAQTLDEDLRQELLDLSQGSTGLALAKLGELDYRVAHVFADAAGRVLDLSGMEAKDVRAIGSHGQTLYHAPDAAYPFSLQIGDPNIIAARTGITTVADFRRRDLALGGQGAPLVPAFHHALFHSDSENRCVVNIGGIANITLLAKDGVRVTGFDTGPGNALLDQWAAAHLGEPFDEDGRWARTGHVLEMLLQQLTNDPFFRRPPPKSTGREYFSPGWLRRQLEALTTPPAPADVQRTLCELTAQTIASAIDRFGPGDERVLLCGGGARNPVLAEAVAEALAPRPVTRTDDYGLQADWVEGCAFAWLAMRTINGQPGNLPAVTGAREAAVLGGIYAGRPE